MNERLERLKGISLLSSLVLECKHVIVFCWVFCPNSVYGFACFRVWQLLRKMFIWLSALCLHVLFWEWGLLVFCRITGPGLSY